ncbi:hypothetical protein CHF27_001580 [Romboutsia maritimum]|uniref:HlyD family efflux transporter periplasmic adaptor subunit n=1 Tax=Romboutsia maritimum TaxID=2020948 RepID=A0A371IWQ4_9FIRM|nr:hypothetical protein CHF27_001580 [Romboutsia maritimum]
MLRKLKYSKILILGVFIYLMFQIGMEFISKNVDTLVLQSENLEAKITKKGLIIRDEYIVKSDIDGSVNLLVKEGEKVKKSQEVAQISSENTDKDINKKIDKLDKEIDKLKTGESNISSKDIEVLNKNINSSSDKIQTNLLNNDYDGINEDIKKANKDIKERNDLLNNDIDSIKLKTKEEQIKMLILQKEKGILKLSSSISGIISYKFDGKEDKFTYDKINEITKKDIQNTDNQYEEVKKDGEDVNQSETILRVVDNYNYYVAICVDKDEVKNFKLNQNIKLRNDKQEIDSKVEKIYDDKENFIIILKISNQNVGIYDTRVKEFDIIYRQMEGLKVPKTSVEKIGTKRGVYVIDEESKTVNFVELYKIAYEDDNFIFIDCYNDDSKDSKSINIYDKIILKPNIISKNMRIK